MIVVTAHDPTRLGALVQLADEMVEDPRCQVVIPAAHEDEGLIVSVWADDVAPDVESGLVAAGWATRRLLILE